MTGWASGLQKKSHTSNPQRFLGELQGTQLILEWSPETLAS